MPIEIHLVRQTHRLSFIFMISQVCEPQLAPVCVFHTQWNNQTARCYLISTGRALHGSVITVIGLIQNLWETLQLYADHTD